MATVIILIFSTVFQIGISIVIVTAVVVFVGTAVFVGVG